MSHTDHFRPKDFIHFTVIAIATKKYEPYEIYRVRNNYYLSEGTCTAVTSLADRLKVLIDLSIFVHQGKNFKLLTISTDRVNIKQEVLYEIAGTNMALCTSYQDLMARVEKIVTRACDTS